MAKSHSLAGTSIPADWLPKDKSALDLARNSRLARLCNWTPLTDGFIARQSMAGLWVLDFNTKPPTSFFLPYPDRSQDIFVTAVTPLKAGKFITVIEKASGEDKEVVWDAKNRDHPIVTERTLLSTGRGAGQWNTCNRVCKSSAEALYISRCFQNLQTVQSVRRYNEATRYLDISRADFLDDYSLLDCSIIGNSYVSIVRDGSNNYFLRVWSFDKQDYSDHQKLKSSVATDLRIFPLDHHSFMIASDDSSQNMRLISIYTIDSVGKVVFPKSSIKAALYPNPCLTPVGELFLPYAAETNQPGLWKYDLMNQNIMGYRLKGPLEDMMLTPDGELGITVREEGKPLSCQFYPLAQLDAELVETVADETNLPVDVSRMVLQYAGFEKTRDEKSPPFVMPRQNISENVSPLYLDVIKKIDRLRQQIAELKEQSSRAYLTPEKYVQLDDELKDGAVILKALKELEALFEKGDLSFQDCVKSIERAYPKFSSGKISGLLGWVSQTKVHAAFNSILRDLNKIPEREHGELLQRDNPSPKKPSRPGRS